MKGPDFIPFTRTSLARNLPHNSYSSLSQYCHICMAHTQSLSVCVCVSICALLSATFILPNIHLLTLPTPPPVENCVSRWVLKLSVYNTQESDVFFVVDIGFKLSSLPSPPPPLLLLFGHNWAIYESELAVCPIVPIEIEDWGLSWLPSIKSQVNKPDN